MQKYKGRFVFGDLLTDSFSLLRILKWTECDCVFSAVQILCFPLPKGMLHVSLLTSSLERVGTIFCLHFLPWELETPSFNDCAPQKKYKMEKYVTFPLLVWIVINYLPVTSRNTHGKLYFIWRSWGRADSWCHFCMWHFCLLIYKICFTPCSCK